MTKTCCRLMTIVKIVRPKPQTNQFPRKIFPILNTLAMITSFSWLLTILYDACKHLWTVSRIYSSLFRSLLLSRFRYILRRLVPKTHQNCGRRALEMLNFLSHLNDVPRRRRQWTRQLYIYIYIYIYRYTHIYDPGSRPNSPPLNGIPPPPSPFHPLHRGEGDPPYPI